MSRYIVLFIFIVPLCFIGCSKEQKKEQNAVKAKTSTKTQADKPKQATQQPNKQDRVGVYVNEIAKDNPIAAGMQYPVMVTVFNEGETPFFVYSRLKAGVSIKFEIVDSKGNAVRYYGPDFRMRPVDENDFVYMAPVKHGYKEVLSLLVDVAWNYELYKQAGKRVRMRVVFEPGGNPSKFGLKPFWFGAAKSKWIEFAVPENIVARSAWKADSYIASTRSREYEDDPDRPMEYTHVFMPHYMSAPQHISKYAEVKDECIQTDFRQPKIITDTRNFSFPISITNISKKPISVGLPTRGGGLHGFWIKRTSYSPFPSRFFEVISGCRDIISPAVELKPGWRLEYPNVRWEDDMGLSHEYLVAGSNYDTLLLYSYSPFGKKTKRIKIGTLHLEIPSWAQDYYMLNSDDVKRVPFEEVQYRIINDKGEVVETKTRTAYKYIVKNKNQSEHKKESEEK